MKLITRRLPLLAALALFARHHKQGRQFMKSKNKLIICAFATALGLLPLQARAGIWSHGWDFSVPVTSRQQAESLKPGTKLAMSCAKCKTVQVMDVDKKGEFLAWFTPKTKHTCAGCGGTWQYVNVAKGARGGGYTHTCSKCGDKSMYCCSTTHPVGRTKGM